MRQLAAGNSLAFMQNITLAPEGLTCLWIPKKSTFNRSAPMSDPNSPQVKFLYEYLQAVQRRDLDHLAKCFHKDYRNTRYPRSLGMPERNKEEHLEYVAGTFNTWTEFEVNYIGRYWIPLAVAESPLQHTIHSITDTPGKIIYHVCIPDVQINIAFNQPGTLPHRSPSRRKPQTGSR